MRIKTKTITSAAIGYLLLPFIIFCMGWLKLYISIPISILLLYFYYRIIRTSDSNENIKIDRKDFWIGISLITIWVFLSGIGGFTFQNWDHHFRNALFRDLINSPWPVYFSDTSVTQANNQDNPLFLIYYFGLWLPPAIIGKVFGYSIGQLFLFLYVLFGVGLTVILLKNKINSSLWFAALLIIGFSGMDIIGTILYKGATSSPYPSLWPPISHLEWWAQIYQFSSFTTQLYWVFNQAIPIWICVLLYLNFPSYNNILYLWSLTLFLAPIPSIGFVLFIVCDILSNTFKYIWPSFFRKNTWVNSLKISLSETKTMFSSQNILGGGIVLIISSLFFTANQTSSDFGFLNAADGIIFHYLLFLLIEGGILLALIFPLKKNDISWYVVGFSLIISPLIFLGNGANFSYRASIPALIYLMVWAGEIIQNDRSLYRWIIVLIFLIGSFTPIYEINRSIYRTFDYIINRSQYVLLPEPSPYEALDIPARPEYVHPHSIVADDLISIEYTRDEFKDNYLSKINGTPLELILKIKDK